MGSHNFVFTVLESEYAQSFTRYIDTPRYRYPMYRVHDEYRYTRGYLPKAGRKLRDVACNTSHGKFRCFWSPREDGPSHLATLTSHTTIPRGAANLASCRVHLWLLQRPHAR